MAPRGSGRYDLVPSLSAKPAPRRVVLVLFEGTKLLDAAGPLQVFADARTPAGAPAYETLLVSEQGGAVATDAGAPLMTTTFRAASARPVDTLLVSGGDAAYRAARAPALLRFLARAAPRCRRFGSVCLGAFVLAAGGHLRGRRATTHWEACAALAAASPTTRVAADAIFVRDGALWTSAGVTAGIDMALAMVEEDLGRAEAMRIARNLVLFLRRPGGQSQFSGLIDLQALPGAGRFDELVAFMRADLSADLSAPRLAARAGMSERNFARVFAKTFGDGPAAFVERLRVDAACESLEAGATLAQALRRGGFGDDERMRRAFHRRRGVSPRDYAARFR